MHHNSPPPAVTAGTTLTYRRHDARYPASQGWVYTLAMRIPGYTPVAATADGDAFVFAIPAADTAPWPAGTYAFSERVTLGDEVHELRCGTLTVRPNLASPLVGSDGRTHNERTLALLDAAIEGRVVDGIENYSIAGRAVSKIPIKDLVELRDKYRMYVALERGRGRLAPVHISFGTERDVGILSRDTYGVTF